MRRLAARIAVGLALAAIVHYTMRSKVHFPLPPEELYAVATEANQTTFDLPLTDAREQYLLVVSNVARELENRKISLAVEPVDNVALLPYSHVDALAPCPLRSDPGFYTSTIVTPVTYTSHEAKRRTFWLHVGGSSTENPGAYRKIDAQLQGRGQYVRVYVDRDDRLPPRTVDAIIEQFDHSIRPMAVKSLGLPKDIDGDGTFAVLVTGWLGRLDGGAVSLGGMVNPNDFETTLEAPFSNQADVLYLNANVRPGRHLETLLAHEFAHAISCSGRQDHRPLLFASAKEESWLSEAISHVAENLESDNWTNLDHRVARFLETPDQTPLVVANYRSAGLWRAAGPRGSTYLFLRWCVDHYGTGLLPALIYSSRSGIANIEAATGEPFEELYRHFASDLFLRTIETSEHSTANSSCVDLPRIDLASPLGKWGLAGPRYDSWELSDPATAEREFQLRGTTSRYFIVSSSKIGPRRIHIASSPGSRLQVTLVRLPDALPQLHLETIPTDHGKWKLVLSNSSGTPLELSHVAWDGVDNRSGDSHRSPRCFTEDQLMTMFDDACLPGGGELVGQPQERPNWSSEPVTVQVVARDPQGRRVTAWATLNPMKAPVGVADAGTGVLRR